MNTQRALSHHGVHLSVLEYGHEVVGRVDGKIKAARCLAVGRVESQGTTMFVAKVRLPP